MQTIIMTKDTNNLPLYGLAFPETKGLSNYAFILVANTEATVTVPANATDVVIATAKGADVWIGQLNNGDAPITLPTGTPTLSLLELNPIIRGYNVTPGKELRFICSESAGVQVNFFTR